MVAAVAPTMTGLWSDRRARAEKTSRDLRADLAHAGLAEFLAKRGLEPYADGFASLGASKPSKRRLSNAERAGLPPGCPCLARPSRPARALGPAQMGVVWEV